MAKFNVDDRVKVVVNDLYLNGFDDHSERHEGEIGIVEQDHECPWVRLDSGVRQFFPESRIELLKKKQNKL